MKTKLKKGKDYKLEITGFEHGFENKVDKPWGFYYIMVFCPKTEDEVGSSSAREAYQAIGSIDNAVFAFAILGAISTIYFGVNAVSKLLRTNDFQRIDEAEC